MPGPKPKPHTPILEPCRVRLHLLSPIHIGTGEEFDPFSYIIRDGRLFLIDLVKWMEMYPEKEELHNMMDSDSFSMIRSYIAEHFDLKTSAAAIRCEIPIQNEDLLKTYQKAIQNRNAQNQVLIHPTMRNDLLMEAYLPGSSIKGAIRTAIADYFAKDAGVESRDEHPRNNPEYNKKIFGSIQNDPLRKLKIPDVSLGKNSTVIMEATEYPLKDKTLTPKGAVEVTKSLCESGKACIYPFKFFMGTLDFRFKNIGLQELIDILYRFYVPKYEDEYEKFFQYPKARDIREKIQILSQTVAGLKSNETLIRTGHFSHVECVTLNDVRKPQTRKGEDGHPLPWGQTRTLANGLYPFGWAKLEFSDIVSNPRPARQWKFFQKTAVKIPVQKQPVFHKTIPAPAPLPRNLVLSKPAAEEKPRVSGLLNELQVIQANDRFGMDRLIDALELLEDEAEQKELAAAIQNKLEAAGTWKKHPRKSDIEIWLG
jgi:hypothetical protein